jgi:peptidoglycan/LPS O-acetylase OafA/YrhL
MPEISKKNIQFYFPQLDGLRFFAFLLVFIHHHNLLENHKYLSFLHTFGWIGVDLFFVLSSFLITKLLIKEYENNNAISYKKFYLRRLLRIWPLYFSFIFFSIIIHFIKNGGFENIYLLRLFGLLTFSDNLLALKYGYNPFPYISHFWTITYEEQFYILIPFVIMKLIRSTIKIKIITLISNLFLFSIIRFVFIALDFPHPAIWVLPITHFESIIFGIVIAFGGFEILKNYINPIYCGLIGVIFFVFICLLPNLDKISYLLILSYTFVGISTSFILFSVLNSENLSKFLSNKILVFLGKRSFGLYVFHFFGNEMALIILHKLNIPKTYLIISFFLSLTITIILSIISYKYIEIPFLKIKKKFEMVYSRPI